MDDDAGSVGRGFGNVKLAHSIVAPLKGATMCHSVRVHIKLCDPACAAVAESLMRTRTLEFVEDRII